MALQALPTEIIDQIISFLAQSVSKERRSSAQSLGRLSDYASTSVLFHHAIERHTFSSLSIESSDLAIFERYVSHSRPRRRASLQDVTFTSILPVYSETSCARFERSVDRQHNDKVFSTAIEALFVALSVCDNVDGAAPIRLELENPYSMSDADHRDPEERLSQQLAVDMGKRKDLFGQRYAHSYLDLSLGPGTPLLGRVTCLVVSGQGPRHFSPSSAFSLLKVLPRVSDVTLQLYDEERRNPELRKTLRDEFAQALNNGQCKALKQFDLQYQHEGPGDHKFRSADMRIERGDKMCDTFSIGLNHFLSGCSRLTELRLGGPMCVDESLFWPIIAHAEDGRWPNLKNIYLTMSLVRPDGNWYMEKDDNHPIDEPSRQDGRFALDEMGEPDLDLIDGSDATYHSSYVEDDSGPDDYEEYREGLKTGDAYWLSFRCQPNDALERVLSAAARAVAVMPQLRSLTLTINIPECLRTNEVHQKFELAYDAIDSQHLDPEARVAKLQWTSPSEWVMSDELETLWGEVIGPMGVIEYEHW